MKKNFRTLFLLLLLTSTSAQAQFNRTTYFMENVGFRQQLNPALTPQQGYFKIPVIGSLNTEVVSNSLGSADIIDMAKNESGADYFMNERFFNRLKNENKLHVDLSTDVLSFGWFKGKGFWNVNVSLKADVGANISRNVFEFMRDTRSRSDVDWTRYSGDLGQHTICGNAYIETGLGYAHPIGDKLTVGGKLKLLFGAANFKVDARKITVETNLSGIDPHQNWEEMTYEEMNKIQGTATVTTDAVVETSMKGLEIETDRNGYIDNIRHGGTYGVAGVGMGMDLGATYKITDDIQVSAALLDLGFISWDKNSSKKGVSNAARSYEFNVLEMDDANEFRHLLADASITDVEWLQIKQAASKARSTSLSSTLVLGGEYKLADDKLTLGVLSTTRFAQPYTYSELTLSSAYAFNRHIGLSLSYSMIQSGGKGLGFGLKLGPIILATDYLYFSNNTQCANALVGLSIPLGKRKGA